MFRNFQIGRRWFWVAWALAVIGSAGVMAQPNSPDGLTYKTGYSAMMKLGRALYDQLDKKDQALISPQPISMDVDLTPFVRMLYYPPGPDEPGGKPLRGVWISAGF